MIINGDCLIELKNLPENSVDAICTDPPYGINYQSNMRVVSTKFRHIAGDNDDSRFSAYSEFKRVLKNDSAAVVFCSWKNFAMDYIELSKLFTIRNVIVWFKRGGRNWGFET